MGKTKAKAKMNPHWGSSLDDFLDEEGIREAARAEAVTRVVAWQLSDEGQCDHRNAATCGGAGRAAAKA